MTDLERLSRLRRQNKVKLVGSEGVEEEFILVNIRPKDVSYILSSGGKMKKGMTAEDIDMEDASKFAMKIGEVALDMLKRSFPEADDQLLEDILLQNYQTITENIISQMNGTMKVK